MSIHKVFYSCVSLLSYLQSIKDKKKEKVYELSNLYTILSNLNPWSQGFDSCLQLILLFSCDSKDSSQQYPLIYYEMS